MTFFSTRIKNKTGCPHDLLKDPYAVKSNGIWLENEKKKKNTKNLRRSDVELKKNGRF